MEYIIYSFHSNTVWQRICSDNIQVHCNLAEIVAVLAGTLFMISQCPQFTHLQLYINTSSSYER